jgi:hypothetical protein
MKKFLIALAMTIALVVAQPVYADEFHPVLSLECVEPNGRMVWLDTYPDQVVLTDWNHKTFTFPIANTGKSWLTFKVGDEIREVLPHSVAGYEFIYAPAVESPRWTYYCNRKVYQQEDTYTKCARDADKNQLGWNAKQAFIARCRTGGD